jgi:DEAD/DEAH box helicase domain-containing protein
MKVLVFDLETRNNPGAPEIGWRNFPAQGISYGCAWLSWCDEFRLYGEDTIHILAEDMQKADLITGFNILDFDLPLLRATIERVTNGNSTLDIPALLPKVYDILDDIREALGTKYAKDWRLDDVAKACLSCQKNGDGAMAPELWAQGRHAELCTYVLQDVKVERELWRHVLAHGFVTNRLGGPALVLPQIRRYREPAKDLAPA